MPTISITDDENKPVALPPFKWVPPPALLKYLKAEVIDLVAPLDFKRLADQTLTQAAPKPLQLSLKVGNTFDFGNTRAEINLTPAVRIALTVNATAGADLFENDLFGVPSKVPVGAAYVGLTLEGSIDPGVTGTAGDLTFGMDRNSDVTFSHWRAFANDASQPTVSQAFVDLFSQFGICGDLADVRGLKENDICAITGRNTLKVCGGLMVTASPNPLACVNLPLRGKTVNVQEGPMVGLNTSFTISGSYQIRVRRLGGTLFELSYLKQKGATLKTSVTVGDGIVADFGTTDLLTKLLRIIAPGTDNAALLQGGLTPDEVKTITAGIKGGIDHSLRAALDESLLELRDDEAAFQYQVDLALAASDLAASEALHRALEGDLSGLTALGEGESVDGVIAAGVRKLKSVFTTLRKKEVTCKLNLLGLVNVISIADFLRNTKVIQDPATGDVTITDSETASRINATVDPLKRHEAIRKLLFDSALATAAYTASGVGVCAGLSLHLVHAALNQNTGRDTVSDYLRWFEALNLLADDEALSMLAGFVKGRTSTCVLRAQFTDAQCRAMFLDGQGKARSKSDYLDIGRRAMMALLDRDDRAGKARFDLLNGHWQDAFQMGPNAGLAGLTGLTSADSQYVLADHQMIGDVYDILWWASGMVDAGGAVESMVEFLGQRDPMVLVNDHEFQQRRDDLAKKMATMVGRSKARFQEPWGMTCLYWAAGSRGAWGEIAAEPLLVKRGQAAMAVGAGS